MTLRLTFEAHDVWFFRTSRPFGSADAGSSDGEPYLVPPPGVIFGAIRTALGNHQGVNWAAYRSDWQKQNVSGWIERLGPPEPISGKPWPGAVRLRGCLPVLTGEKSTPLFPMPSFVLEEKSKSRRELALPVKETRGRTSADKLEIALPPDDFEGKTLSGLLKFDAFRSLLLGEKPGSFPENGVVSLDQLAEGEPRVGIARDRARRTVQTGMLYTQTTHRWNSRVQFRDQDTFGLQAFVDGVAPDELPGSLAVPLGGEGRLAWTRVQGSGEMNWIDSSLAKEVRTAIAQAEGWWLYLATPAIFTAGWRPNWIEPKNLSAHHSGQKIGTLVSLVGDAPRPISGWNLAGRCARPARLPMPAGTTYFFELPPGADASTLDAITALQGTCIADELAHAGHGLAFVGAWKRRNA